MSGGQDEPLDLGPGGGGRNEATFTGGGAPTWVFVEVSGEIFPTDDIEPARDSIDGGSAELRITGGFDRIEFTGRITSLEAEAVFDEGQCIDVEVNGQDRGQVCPPGLPADGDEEDEFRVGPGGIPGAPGPGDDDNDDGDREGPGGIPGAPPTPEPPGDLEPPENREVCYVLPFSRLNAITPLSGVEDVEICIPTPEEIAFQVVQEFEESLDLVGRVEQVVRQLVENAPAPTVEIDPGLFGQTVDELDEIVRETVEQALPDLDGLVQAIEDVQDELADVQDDLPGDLTGPLEALQEDVQAVREAVEEREPVELPDVQAEVREAVESLLEDVPGGDILLDPDEFIDDQIDRLADRLVSEEAAEAFREATEDIR